MLDKLEQPSVIDAVKVCADVRVEHPVHFPPSYPGRESIKCMMWPTTRAKSIRETDEVTFVDGIEYLDNGTLDDFVFQRCNAERSFEVDPNLRTVS